MAQENKKPQNSQNRVSTQQIDDAILQLQNAFSDGRLDEHDFDQRTALALKAKTEGELSAILFDLPKIPETFKAPGFPAMARKIGSKAMAIFSGIEVKGPFILPSHYHISAVMGGCQLDLRHALLESHETIITITAIMGGVQIFVPTGVRVTVHSSPIFGGISEKVGMENLPLDAPHITIFAKAIFGGIEIKSKA